MAHSVGGADRINAICLLHRYPPEKMGKWLKNADI